MNGKLGDIGFVELLKMVGKKTGKLSIEMPLSQRYDWYIHEFRVFAVRINGEAVKSQSVLLESALNLINDEDSFYSFINRDALDRFPIEMSFNLEQVISEALTRINTQSPCRKHFPNPVTKFEAVPNIKPQLADDGAALWRRAEYFLLAGASAAILASELKIPLEDMRLQLYRWRMLGLVTPVRVFSVGAASPSVSVSATSQATPLPALSAPPNYDSSPPPSLDGMLAAPGSDSATSDQPPPFQNPSLSENPAPQAPPQVYRDEDRPAAPSPPSTSSTSPPPAPRYKPYAEKPQNDERRNLVRRMLGALFGK